MSRNTGPATFGKSKVSSANKTTVNYELDKSLSETTSASNNSVYDSASASTNVQSKVRNKGRSSDSGSDSDNSSGSSSGKSRRQKDKERNEKLAKERKKKERRLAKEGLDDEETSTKVSSMSKRTSSQQAAAPVKSNEKVLLVKQLQPFSKSVKWDTTDYILHVNKSLKELEAMSDANGNVAIGLGDGTITIERTTPEIHSRMKDTRNVVSAAGLHANPALHSVSEHIVHDVEVISAHNAFPLAMRVQVKNIIGSAKHVAFPTNAESELQNLTFSVHQGEKLENHVVFTNPVDSNDGFKFFNAFPGFTPSNLRLGLLTYAPLGDVERCLVPHSDKKLHPVVMLAQTNIKEVMTRSQKKKFIDAIPPELMSQSADTPGYYIMSQKVFDTFEARCKKGLGEQNPLSAVANPYGAIYPVARDHLVANSSFSPVGSKASVVQGFTKTRIDNELVSSNAKSLWTTASEIDTQRVNAQAKDSARDTRYNFFCRLRVRSLNTTTLAANN